MQPSIFHWSNPKKSMVAHEKLAIRLQIKYIVDFVRESDSKSNGDNFP